VQFKISLEEMHHLCCCFGAGRPPLWRSKACELQDAQLQLCASTVISDARTASDFLNGHRPVPGCLQLPLYNAATNLRHGTISRPPDYAKKVMRRCKFSEKFGFWRNIMYQMMQLRMHRF
jgi:hypothetical protein